MANIETIGIEFDSRGLKLGQQELEKTGKAAEKTADALDDLSTAAKKTGDQAEKMIQRQRDLNEALRDGASSASASATATLKLAGATDAQIKEYNRLLAVQKKLTDSSSSVDNLTNSFKGLGAALPLLAMGAVAAQAVKIADAYSQLTARLALATSSTKELASAQEALFRIAQTTGTDLAATVDLYSALARSTKELGVSQRQLLAVTDTFNKAISLSGGSAQSAEDAILQFNQAMAGGVLRGEEFNSIAEQAPRIMEILASSMGKTRGELRAMAEQGQLTADVVLPAIIRGARQVSEEFDRMPTTVSQATQIMRNSLTQLVGEMDRVLGGAGSLAGVIIGLSDVLDTVAKHFRDTGKSAQDSGDSFSLVVEVFKVLAVIGSEVSYVVKAVGTEIGGMAAQIAALSRLDWQAFGAIREAMVADAEQARRNIDALTAAIMKSGSTAKKAGDNYKDVSDEVKNAAAMADKFTTRAEKQRKELDELRQSFEKAKVGITDNNKLQQMAIAYREQATAIEKKYAETVKTTTKVASDAGKAEAKLALERASAMTEDEKFARNRARVFEERAKQEEAAQRRVIDAAQKQAASVAEKAAALQLEVKQWGMTEEAIYSTIAAQKSEQAEVERRAGTSPAIVAALEAEAESYRSLARSAGDLDKLRLGEDQAKKAATEWQRTTDQIRDGLTNALMRAFESGKGFGRALRDSLVNMFKTMVLEPTLRAVVQGGLSAVGMSAATQAAGGAAGGAGGSVLSNVPGTMITGGIGSALMAGGSSLAAAGFSSAGGFVGGLGSGIGSFGSISAMGANLSAGSTALAAGNIAGGIGSILGTALPVLAVLAGIAAALGAFDRGGPKAGGQSFFSTATGGEMDRGYRLYTPNQADASVQKITQSIGQGYKEMAKGLGFKTIQDYVFGLGFDTDPQGKAGSRLTSQLIGQNQPGAPKLYENLNQEIKGDIKDALGLEAQRLMMAALKDGLASSGLQADLAAAMSEVFGGVDLASATQEQITAMQGSLVALKQVRDGFESLGKMFPQLSGLAFKTEKALADTFGGMPNFVQTLAKYQENYYTQAERAAMATSSLDAQFQKLGVSVPANREEFRRLVEAQDLSTEAGRNTYAGLLMVSEAFANLNPELEKMGAITAESIGLGADAIKSQVLAALTSGDDAALAGQAFGDTLVQGVYDALAQNAAQQITNIITQGLVDPIIKAVATGTLVTDAISEASISAMVKKAEAVAAAFAELMKSEDFRGAIERIRNTGAGIGSTVGGVFAPTITQPVRPAIPAMPTSAGDGGEAARLAADEERRQAEILARSRQQDIDLLKAQGKAQDVVNLERERELEALTKLDASGGLADRQRRIYAAADESTRQAETERAQKAIEDARRTASSSQTALMARYGDPIQQAYDQIKASAEEYGVGGILAPLKDLILSDPAKLKDTVAGMIKGADPATESGRKLIATLTALSPAFDLIIGKATDATQAAKANALANEQLAAQMAQSRLQAAESAADLARQNVDAALRSVQDAVQSERDALTVSYERESVALKLQIDASAKAADRFRSLSATLRGALQMEAAGTDVARRGEAQAQLRAMVLMARGTGILPSQEALKAALDGVSKPSTGLFKSFSEYLLDFDKTKADIQELADLTDSQLSVEEQTQKTLAQQLETLRAGFEGQNARLDGILQAAQAQVAGLMGVQTGIMTVAQAMAGLSSAIDASRSANSSLAAAQASARGSTLRGLAIQATGGDSATILGAIRAASLAGYTPEEMAAAFNAIPGSVGTSAAEIISEAKKAGIPGFAMGGVVSGPTLAMVGEGRYSEAVVPLPDGRAIPVKMSGEIKELIAEIRGLRDDVRAGDAGNVAVANRLDRTLTRWDRDGLPETRTT